MSRYPELFDKLCAACREVVQKHPRARDLRVAVPASRRRLCTVCQALLEVPKEEPQP